MKEADLPLAKEAKAVREGLEKLEKRFWWPRDTVGITPDSDILSRLSYVRGYLGSSWSRPNPTHLEYLRLARRELEAALTDLNAFYAKEVEAYRTSLAAQNLALVPAARAARRALTCGRSARPSPRRSAPRLWVVLGTKRLQLAATPS